MIIVKLQGGLGNQLFQWAFGLSRLSKLNTELKFDSRSYEKDELRKLEISNIIQDIKIATLTEIQKTRKENNKFRLLSRKFKSYSKPYYKRDIISEHTYLYDKSLDENSIENAYYEGYWQNEKYFKKHKTLILSKIDFSINQSKEYEQYKKEILDSENSVSIHVRRGDYLNDKRIFEIHGICSKEYYHKAIEIMTLKHPKTKLFIFSNDLDWVKNNFNSIKNRTIISKTKTVFEDLELMSLCRNQIIANSSLSWWGAWLNKNKQKHVIAPKKWFNKTSINFSELVPKEWEVIDL